MPQSRKTQLRADQYNKNVTKRGAVSSKSKRSEGYPVGPVVLGLFLFVVVGSAVIQIIASATKGGI